MRRELLCIMFLMSGCSSRPGLGSRIEYDVSELPRPLIYGEAGSCTPRMFMSYADAQGLKWAVGTKLEVRASWPDRQDCTASIAGPTSCPAVQASVDVINPNAWGLGLMAVAALVDLQVQTLGDGKGGFAMRANGDMFKPDFMLTAASPSSIWFQLADGPHSDPLPTPINDLFLAPGRDAIVAVTLRDAAGEHVCGPVPATVTQTSTAFTIERLTDTDFVNLPYHVIAGDTGGDGLLQFAVGGLTAALHVVIGP